MSRFYPDEKQLTPRDIEFYVQGLWDLYRELGGESHCKMYDPLTIIGKTAHSYVLDLDDGGRHHPFTNLEELRRKALKEFAEKIKYELAEEKETPKE